MDFLNDGGCPSTSCQEYPVRKHHRVCAVAMRPVRNIFVAAPLPCHIKLKWPISALFDDVGPSDFFVRYKIEAPSDFFGCPVMLSCALSNC